MPIPQIRKLDASDPAEVDRLYEICLRTGAAGNDASADYHDGRLMGTLYAGQYAKFSPQWCNVLVDGNDVVQGYVIGTPDTASFESVLRSEWWPAAREKYPLAEFSAKSVQSGFQDAQLVADIHGWSGTDPEIAREYPAHFHIDVLPEFQGGGNGRRLLFSLLDEFRDSGVTAVHMGVSAENERALGFYEHVGFRRVVAQPWGFVLGMKL